MSASLDYVWEKYYKSTQILAKSDGNLRDRVVTAYREEAMHASTPSNRVPPNLAKRIRVLHQRMIARPDPSDIGQLRASVELMEPEELREVAEEIVDIAFEAARALARSRAGIE